MTALARARRPVTIYRGTPASLVGMMTEIDIWRVAYLMLWWYGETAQEESARRADEFAEEGDLAGAACWHRIIDAIEQLAITTPCGVIH